MIEIPPQRDAAVAWAALPEPVRRDALHNVENGGAPDDPAVAAIVVGVLRVHRPMRSWSHRILSELPYAAIIGGLIALQYMGMLSLERGLTYAGGTVFAIALAVAAIEGSRRFLVFWALVAMAAAGIVAVLRPGSPGAGMYGCCRCGSPRPGCASDGSGPSPGPMSSARTARPSPAARDGKPAIRFALRDRRDVVMELDAVQVPPEQIVLAVRAYTGAALAIR